MNMTAEAVVETHRSMSTVAEMLAPYEKIEAVPPGRVLFREGTEPEGVYYLHSGEVDLCFSSAKSGTAKSLLLATGGEILGLTCVMSSRAHDCSATTRTTCITGFVEKNRFLRLLDEKPALWLVVLRMISSNINACWDCMRNLAGAR
jgi:CRP-like cAMP-binding protein